MSETIPVRNLWRWIDVVCALLLPFCSLNSASVFAADETEIQHFEQQVRPLLIAKCVKCHGADKSEAGLRLDRGEGVARGGDSGVVIRAG